MVNVRELPWEVKHGLALEVSLKKQEDIPDRENSMRKGTKESESCEFLSTTDVWVLLEHSSGGAEQENKGCAL